VVLRNLVIYHPANARGMYAIGAHNLIMENVEVIAYGNDWGAQPCPARWPMGGYDCSNLVIRKSKNIYLHNIRVENGSNGIRVWDSPDAHLNKVVARNARGPYPAGNCFAITRSHNTILENWHCYNDPEIAWLTDSLNVWRSSNVTVRDGVVDGSNAPIGMCVSFQ